MRVIPLLESRWLKVESHTVQSDDGKLAEDWIWMDVLPHISALVHLRDTNKYALFRQRKYGLPREALAVVGGHVNVKTNEEPRETAERELLEEMG